MTAREGSQHCSRFQSIRRNPFFIPLHRVCRSYWPRGGPLVFPPASGRKRFPFAPVVRTAVTVRLRASGQERDGNPQGYRDGNESHPKRGQKGPRRHRPDKSRRATPTAAILNRSPWQPLGPPTLFQTPTNRLKPFLFIPPHRVRWSYWLREGPLMFPLTSGRKRFPFTPAVRTAVTVRLQALG